MSKILKKKEIQSESKAFCRDDVVLCSAAAADDDVCKMFHARECQGSKEKKAKKKAD